MGVPSDGPGRPEGAPRRADEPAPAPRHAARAARPEEDRLLPGPKPKDPGRIVKQAQDRLRRKALQRVRALEDLARKADEDARPCPTCGRGMPRAEEIRLRANQALLDRTPGMTPGRGAAELGETGPLIVLPPGTRVALIAEPTEVAEQRGVTRPVVHDTRMRRADEVDAGREPQEPSLP